MSSPENFLVIVSSMGGLKKENLMTYELVGFYFLIFENSKKSGDHYIIIL
jgi:hypothetical protein